MPRPTIRLLRPTKRRRKEKRHGNRRMPIAEAPPPHPSQKKKGRRGETTASIRRNAGVHGLLQPLIYTNPIANAENQRPTTEWEEEKKEITAA